jgi:hypothetical protein
MKNIILASFIFVAVVFSFEKSFGQSGVDSISFSPGCYGYFWIGTNHYVYRFHDENYVPVTINIDTTYSYDAVINDTLTYRESGVHCPGCVPHIVLAFNDTGLYIENFTTCLNTDMTVIFHVMRASSPLSVSEIYNPSILQIYPNPTLNNFTIKNVPSGETSLLQIINTIGEVIYTEKLFGKKEYLIDAKIAKGVYFVRVNNFVKKLVVE